MKIRAEIKEMENRNKIQPKVDSLKDLQINKLRAGLIRERKRNEDHKFSTFTLRNTKGLRRLFKREKQFV